jgi:calcineurin-like phosphoesterase family protein
MIYLTADTHLGHANIIKYCNRPFVDVNDMDNNIIMKWNNAVTHDDTVFVLGDFAFNKGYKSVLNGNVILLRGNHDSVKPKPCIESIKIRNEGHTFHLTHKPEHADPCVVTLCGHVHQLWKILWVGGFPIINVGVDVWDFMPVSMERINAFICDETQKRVKTVVKGVS